MSFELKDKISEPSCPKHEEYLVCGEAPPCQTTCENYGRPCDVRPTSYCPYGCYCKSGYARHPITNQCVHLKNCPMIYHEYITQNSPSTTTELATETTTTSTTTSTTTQKPPNECGKNEEYSDCGPACQVECSNLGRDCPKGNVKCTKGCFCKPGYARDHTSRLCIAQRNCRNPFCPRNEIWLICGQAPECQEMCDGIDRECEARKYGVKCPSGCYCRKGYARHPTTGECVKKRDCPRELQCVENEEFRNCGYRCREICNSENSCYHEKCEAGCFCSEGYVRINVRNVVHRRKIAGEKFVLRDVSVLVATKE
ncbi:zonadhesin-like [Phlebotomus argentipes]|uniref:zonadhesin-like n=1 Tax=Phlebotomus argentipes TaxID=94469 RepID=UPI002892C729|nr:zonadhesin-like [Phlebotomus argentipes]